ncbi:aminopeptidase N-like [Schistocerca serialis cubense]|uniref:aminopeptidase N-like n=1 Tax=Schistocerca serialis cubense TaxID=2023355 RepID=UPI00214E153A|nr:aminopeptidase N-like [Schistocerca serialis cubense]
MRSVWCLVVLTLLVTVAHGQDDRLPGESRPSSQMVDITVYRENEGERSFTFEGQTSVTVEVVRDTAQLVLHAAVNVSSLAVRYQVGDVIGSSYEQPQDGSDFLVVSLQEQVAEGSLLVLDIGFSANLGNREPGFSRYDYQGRDGQEAVYATQFMPNYARRALPCYDEPALKARYQLNMRTKPHLVDAEGFRGYYFQQTPPISAYQLSWVLHEMVGRVSSEDTSTVVWQVTSRSDQFGYASHMGPRSVAAMEQLVGVPYANYDIDKMDHIAVPGYIEEGVSCLGIITYKESSVLVDDDYTSEATKERVLGIMQHEAAHQWFGGLVSPSWWNDLWLTEGFASYFQWIAAALVQPSWQLREVFVVNTVLQAAMPADVAPGSYPLSKSPNISAQQAFDEYFEEKGYYRANYDEQNWALLTAQLLRDPLVVPAVARAQLLDDAASLAGAAQLLPAGTALQLASYLRFEYGYIPWRAVPGVLRNLELLVDEDVTEDFKEFALSLIHHMAILLRYHEQPGEDHTTRILRAVIVSIACNYGEPSCLNSMYEQLQHFMAAPGNASNQVGPDLKRVVYCYGAQQGGDDAYNFLMDLYQTTDIVSELNDIVLGASCSQLVDGLRLLELTATGAKGGFRREHLQWLLEGLLQRRHTLPSALQFLSRGANLLSRPGEKQAARKLLRQAILEMRDDQLLEKVQQAAVALEDESLIAAAQWRHDVIASGAAARRDAACWLKGKAWRL